MLIEATGLAARHGVREVLHGVNFAIRSGEIVTVVGPNGSGKTTFLRCLIGAIHPSAGQVTRAPGLRLGYVPQRLQIDATLPLSVARFLTLGAAARVDVARALAQVGLGADLSTRPMAALSGGQFQRVLLARALVGSPDLLILDEPTQALDQPGTAGFYRLLEEVRHATGCAVLMVSHDLHVVMSASDRVICLNGHICCEGTPSVVSEAPEYRALFGLGTLGTMALYRHGHDHVHGPDGACDHDHGGTA